jgi:hypothetical protein
MSVAQFLLHHRHDARECGVAYASFKGHRSPLRRSDAVSSCLTGGHELWWVVEAVSSEAALAFLPHFVASRATVTPIRKVLIP